MKAETGSSSADDSYRSLFDQHHRSLFRLAVLLVGDRHAADELTAEIFARFFRSGDPAT